MLINGIGGRVGDDHENADGDKADANADDDPGRGDVTATVEGKW